MEQIGNQLQAQADAQSTVVDIGEASRRSLQRKIDGLSKSLSDPDITEMSRKILLQQLDQAAKEMEALDQQRATKPHLNEDIAFFEKLRADSEFLASLPLTWEDEPVQWRRSWIRRFIDRVEVENPSRGHYRIAIRYQNGQESTIEKFTKPGVTEEELAVIRRLWDSSDRPHRYYADWMIERLREHGFHRCKRGIYRTLAIALGRRVK